jgi:hypothetical protein
LDYALTTGRLADARAEYEFGQIADASTTTFTLNAAGMAKSVNAYALFESQPGGPDAADRAGMAQLAARLTDFSDDPLAAALRDETAYDPDEYGVTLYFGESPQASTIPQAWPWPDQQPDDFPHDTDGPVTGTLTRDQVSRIATVPNGGDPEIWATAPALVHLAIRPLLPDEIDESPRN